MGFPNCIFEKDSFESLPTFESLIRAVDSEKCTSYLYAKNTELYITGGHRKLIHGLQIKTLLAENFKLKSV